MSLDDYKDELVLTQLYVQFVCYVIVSVCVSSHRLILTDEPNIDEIIV